MNLLLQNFLLQLSSLLLGVISGSFLSWLAAEELSLYKKHISLVFQFLSFAALLAPLLFFLYFFDFKRIIPFFVLLLVYTLIFWKTKNNPHDIFHGFLYIVPLMLFLASGNQEVFFLTLSLFLVTVILSILSFAHSLEKMNLLKKYKYFAQEFSGFFFMTVLLYGITFVLTFF